MAYINLCGFETGDTSECRSTQGSPAAQSSIKLSGTYALKIDTNSQWANFRAFGADSKNTNASVATSYVRFAFYCAALPSTNPQFISVVADASANFKHSLAITTAGKIQMRSDATGGTVNATSTTTLSTNTWYILEYSVPTSASTQTVTLLIYNGGGSLLETLAPTGCSVQNTNAAQVYLGDAFGHTGTSGTYYYDDFAWKDDAFPALGSVIAMVPAGNSATNTGWTASTGTKWQAWNTVPPNASTPNNSVSASLQIYTSTLPTCASLGINGTINCVKHVLQVKGSGAETAAVAGRSGTTNYLTASPAAPGASNILLSLVETVDPTDSAAWTVSKLNALETGARSDAGLGSLTATFAAAMVDFTPDTTPPTFSSASVDSTGLSVAVELTETSSPPILPASSVTGYTVNVGGVSKTISAVNRTGNTEDTITMAAPILKGATVTLDYTPGNVTDSASNAMLAFSGQSVTNNSNANPVNVITRGLLRHASPSAAHGVGRVGRFGRVVGGGGLPF